MKCKRYEQIAAQVRSIKASTNKDHHAQAVDRLDAIMRDAPSGSGFDNGTTISLNDSKVDRIVFNTAFHHMDSNGYYSGWTSHRVIIKPDFVFGFDMRITGPNKWEIKDYIAEVFTTWLAEEVTP